MLNAYEQRLIAFYLANAASFLHHRDAAARTGSASGKRRGW